MLFCPTCANLLLTGADAEKGGFQFFCQTCPYVYRIEKPHIERMTYKRKEVDDVLGGEKAWANVDSMEVTCPKCEHNRAYFMMIQIRSADEPSSIFFKCCSRECQHQWREK